MTEEKTEGTVEEKVKEKGFLKALGRWWGKFAALVQALLIVGVLIFCAWRLGAQGDSLGAGLLGGLAGFFIGAVGGGLWQRGLATVAADK